MDKPKKPFFGAGLTCDKVILQKEKPDCIGVFNTFNTWAFPCNRSWHTVISLFNPPKRSTLIFSIRKKGTKFGMTAKVADFNRSNTSPHTISGEMDYEFESAGVYEIECTLKDYPILLKIPFMVELQEWPQFSEEEIQYASEHSNLTPSIRATVSCKDCKHVYVFEEVYNPNTVVDGGVLRFPANGRFECTECGRIIEIKDLQGRLRNILKETITKQMGGK